MHLPFRRRNELSSELRQPRMMEGQDTYTFRRSRTITGTVTDQVKTADVADSQLKTPRMRLHELHMARRRLATRLLITLLILAGLTYLMYQYTGTSRAISYTATPVATTDDEGYISTIHKYYADNPLQQFLFSVDTAAMSRYVQAVHPEVASVAVARTKNGIRHVLTLRQPILSWTTRKGQFYVDATGTPFTRNYYREPSLKVQDKSGISDSSGGAIISSRFIRFVGLVISALQDKGVASVQQVVLPPNTTHEVDFRVSGYNFDIKTSIDRDPAGQAEDIANALSYIAEKGISPSYIDVRVEGKAFYRDR